MIDANSLSVHRCRFVDFIPAGITSVAFSPFPLLSLRGRAPTVPGGGHSCFGILAVGRLNGNIELYQWPVDSGFNRSSRGCFISKVCCQI